MSKSQFKLEIELIPRHSWGRSLANSLPKQDWDKLRRMIYRRYNWTCQFCSAYGVQVHCHEVWAWDDRRKIQKLEDLICLCKDCHEIKHWGRTIELTHSGEISSKHKDYLVRHFCEVNKCTEKEMMDHVLEVGERNFTRSKYRYKLDLSRLKPIIQETEKCLKLRSKLSI